MQPTEANKSSPEMVVGLDIGTTNTGVAFLGPRKSICSIVDWPDGGGRTSANEKVPTEIAYTDDGIICGYSISDDVPRVYWIKLALEKHVPGEAAKIQRERLQRNDEASMKDPVTILADYLTWIYDIWVENMNTTYGKNLWKTMDMTLVVTVPAVWSDAAKDKTWEAVRKSGFNSTNLPCLKDTITVTEPEAAAIDTLDIYKDTPIGKSLKVNDCFLVCDMGGGTVDLVAYTIKGLEPTSLEEATIGTGDQCGSSFLEREFVKLIASRFGRRFHKLSGGVKVKDISWTSLPPALGKLVGEFTKAKTRFNGSKGMYLRLPQPFHAMNDKRLGVSGGEITIERADLVDIFEVPLRKTRDLIMAQITQAERNGSKIKHIFLVGGFAMSKYMFDHITALAHGHGITVLRPANPWTSVVRGAVMRGQESQSLISVRSRKCRRYYGTRVTKLFISGLHNEADAYICAKTGVKRARQQMNWIVRKDQDLPTTISAHGCSVQVEIFWNDDIRWSTFTLLAADSDAVPSHSQDPKIYKVADLDIDLSSVPATEWQPRRSPDGRKYFRIEYEVQIGIHSQLEFSVSVAGKRYGSIKANYA